MISILVCVVVYFVTKIVKVLVIDIGELARYFHGSIGTESSTRIKLLYYLLLLEGLKNLFRIGILFVLVDSKLSQILQLILVPVVTLH